MTPPSAAGRYVNAVAGGLVGGLVGGGVAAGVTVLIKEILAVVMRQDRWLLIVLPIVGVVISTVVLHVVAHGHAVQTIDDAPVAPHVRHHPWRSFPLDMARADLTADVVAAAGREEKFRWRLAPIRAVAIVATVGLGAPMGTESPAAHLGVAAGSALGNVVERLRTLARPAGLAGGAAAVAALMGLPLVGFAFMLELGRRRRVALSAERILTAMVGSLVGWGINAAFGLQLIRLTAPGAVPGGIGKALATAVLVGTVSGAIAGLTGVAIYRARAWKASTTTKAVAGSVMLAATCLVIGAIAVPTAAVGPGSAAVTWSTQAGLASGTLLAVALLRAVATVSAVAAGGCGGVFVPFLAIGEIAGRAFVPAIDAPPDLAGAAGAAGGIAGGYRLPVTAATMVIGIGGPYPATLTCLAAVAMAAAAGLGVAWLIERVTAWRSVATAKVTPVS